MPRNSSLVRKSEGRDMARNQRSKLFSMVFPVSQWKIQKTCDCPMPCHPHHPPRELRIHIYVQRKLALVILLWSQPPEEQKMGTFLESLELYQSPSIVN